MRSSHLKFAATYPRDLTVGKVGREARVNLMQARKRGLYRGLNRFLVHGSLRERNARDGAHQRTRLPRKSRFNRGSNFNRSPRSHRGLFHCRTDVHGAHNHGRRAWSSAA